MVSTMKTFINDKIEYVSAKQGIIEVDKYIGTVPSKINNLTKCNASDTSCNDFKKVEDAFKVSTTNNVKSFLTKNPDILIMVFAPWCPHCHTALPNFMKASSTVRGMKPCIMNAEMVDHTLLQDMNVTHFPFIAASHNGMVQSDVFEGPPTVDELVKFSEKNAAPSAAAPSAAAPHAAAPHAAAPHAAAPHAAPSTSQALDELFQ
jgi:thiol-disulfide isomerase/thioredoxin